MSPHPSLTADAKRVMARPNTAEWEHMRKSITRVGSEIKLALSAAQIVCATSDDHMK
jgi:hypothetical protein